MKVKQKLNIIAIATLILLLICFLAFSYSANWKTNHLPSYNSGQFIYDWEHISFSGFDLIKYRPLSGVTFLLLSVLNIVLCISSLSAKRNAPDPKLHVVLPTVAGIQFVYFILSSFGLLIAAPTAWTIVEKTRNTTIYTTDDLFISSDFIPKIIFLLVLMLAYVIICFVKRSPRFFEDKVTASASVHPTRNEASPKASYRSKSDIPIRPETTNISTPANGISFRQMQNYAANIQQTDINYYYQLYKNGIITQEEFDAKKKQLLGL